MNALYVSILDTPIGELVIATYSDRIVMVEFRDQPDREKRLLRRWFPDVPVRRGELEKATRIAFQNYFAGGFSAFEGLPIELRGTPFQKRVWTELRKIPRGETRSYGDIAAHIGQPKAARAVGLANNRNPISIIVPCHRVVGADGALTGYGGGLKRKKWLLDHESLA